MRTEHIDRSEDATPEPRVPADADTTQYEETDMDTRVDDRIEQPAETPSGKSDVPIGAVALVAIAAVVALAMAWFWPFWTTDTIELSAPGETTASCIAFSEEELAKVGDIAFEGTATDVADGTVTLSVDEWFKGGPADPVVLNAPEGMEALIGGVPFAAGEQYLISAQGGSVNYCGFSGPSTPEYRSAFQRAFGG